jgi:hypothetical protein
MLGEGKGLGQGGHAPGIDGASVNEVSTER